MKRENIDAIHRLSKSTDWAVFQNMIKKSGEKYLSKIFELDPKTSEIKFSMKDLFIFYVKFCEHCANLPHEIVQEFVDGGLNNMDDVDIDEYVENIVESVMVEAKKFVEK